MSPVSTSARIFSWSVLPTLRTSVARSSSASCATETGELRIELAASR